MGGLAAGLSDREVALRVMLFEPALRATLRSIYQELGVRTRQEAAAYVASRRNSPYDATLEGAPSPSLISVDV